MTMRLLGKFAEPVEGNAEAALATALTTALGTALTVALGTTPTAALGIAR
jgi:hypothetical protein